MKASAASSANNDRTLPHPPPAPTVPSPPGCPPPKQASVMPRLGLSALNDDEDDGLGVGSPATASADLAYALISQQLEGWTNDPMMDTSVSREPKSPAAQSLAALVPPSFQGVAVGAALLRPRPSLRP